MRVGIGGHIGSVVFLEVGERLVISHVEWVSEKLRLTDEGRRYFAMRRRELERQHWPALEISQVLGVSWSTLRNACVKFPR